MLVRVPTMVTRALASNSDRYDTRAGSGLAERTTDRSVETRW